MAGQMTIGGLSKQTDCNIETIRYYEKIGMLPTPRRTGGGHRVYNDEHARRLQFIRRARTLGFSLDDVRRLLALAEGKPKSCGKVKTLAEAHLEDIQSRIRDLKAMEKVLKQLVSQCTGRTAPDCPIIDSLQH
ncbi:MerR family transcriptional regulator [Nitrospina watsonii]|uniref:Heavy metal resistance transcriptional regulator HmrR n=1 Tax=Nitrospina watsonii TaxID=1323948 RepID=A0ABM9HHB1_9BACT|nr:helix-turn-helix domain-containing protein [Nitrospina watsonii]CAI2719614.1 Heavy metal resistance transcriptional regulator HmrR [Nitrospina watsonii]